MVETVKLPIGGGASGRAPIGVASLVDNDQALALTIADDLTPGTIELPVGVYVAQSTAQWTIRGPNLPAGVDPLIVEPLEKHEIQVPRTATYTLTTPETGGAKVNFYAAETF